MLLAILRRSVLRGIGKGLPQAAPSWIARSVSGRPCTLPGAAARAWTLQGYAHSVFRHFRWLLPSLACALTICPVFGQNTAINADLLSRGPSALNVWKTYRPVPLPPLNTSNGPLLESSIRNKELDLSLSDFLKLVIENGLDVESDRYIYLLAQTDLLRARSGQAARGLPGAPIPNGLFAGAIGAAVGNAAGLSAGGTGATAITGNARQVVIGPRGNFDPSFLVNMSYDRLINPLNTVRVAGTPTVTVPSADLQTRFQQELPFGASYSVSFNFQRQSTTQRFLLYNPAFTSYFSVQVYQPLLNGFGLALNRRFITFAENNRKISREVFSQNLNNILSNAANLYWDYVAMQEQVRVAQQEVAASQRLYDNNRKAFDLGALARLDIVQAESQLAADRRDLVIAQSNLQLQEIRLKSVISKNITPELADAHIVATDPLPKPDDIQIPPVQEALEAAQNRASVRQAVLNVQNQRIAAMYTRNNLLPVFSSFVQFNTYTLAGATTPTLRQILQWEYPEYSAGFSLTFTVRNRSAQADDVRARLELRQAETSLQQVRSQVSLSVRTAITSLIQYRAQVQAAQQAAETSELTLKGEQARLANGISTPYRVILAQRDLVTAQMALTQAQVNYAKALIALELSTGTLLERNGLSFDEAFRGSLWTSSQKQ
jgi:outer membrane protein